MNDRYGINHTHAKIRILFVISRLLRKKLHF